MKEQEPKENKLPICGGCEQSININDPELVYLRHKGKNYHEDCLKLEEAKTSPKETIVFEDKGVSELSFMKAMKESHNKEKIPEEIIFREPPIEKLDFEDLRHIAKEAEVLEKEGIKISSIQKEIKDLILLKKPPKASKQPLEEVEVIKDDIVVKKKTRKEVSMSATWNKEVKRKELKKQIRDELDELQEKQFKLNKEKVNPYWENRFNGKFQDLIRLGDFHFSAPGCDVDKIKKTVKSIKKYKTAVIGMGDWLENANRYSVGAGVYEQTMTPMQQMDEVCKLIEPIKDQIMVLLDGNHEFRTWKECGFRPMQIIGERLGIPYAGFEAFIRMKVKKYTYVVYATHGSTGSRFPWTRMKALEDIMRNVDADITLMGHTHDKLAHEMAYKGITDKKKYGVLTGSFLRDNAFGYAAMKNLPPVKTGIIVLTLSGDHWDVHEKN